MKVKPKTKAQRDRDYRALVKRIAEQNRRAPEKPNPNPRKAEVISYHPTHALHDIKSKHEIESQSKWLQPKSAQDHNGIGEAVIGFGMLLFIGGIVIAAYYFLFYPVVNPSEEYVNLERLNNRQGGEIIGALACFVGVIVAIFGFLICIGNKSESNTK